MRGTKGSLLGLAISADWARGRGSDLIGKRVTSAADLATLGACCATRTETMRYFLMKGDKVVLSHGGIESDVYSGRAYFVLLVLSVKEGALTSAWEKQAMLYREFESLAGRQDTGCQLSAPKTITPLHASVCGVFR